MGGETPGRETAEVLTTKIHYIKYYYCRIKKKKNFKRSFSFFNLQTLRGR